MRAETQARAPSPDLSKPRTRAKNLPRPSYLCAMLRCTPIGKWRADPRTTVRGGQGLPRVKEPLIDGFLSNIYQPETFGQLSHVSVVAKGVMRVIPVDEAGAPAHCWRRR